MRRNPVYVFSNRTSQGIFDVPLESMIQIIDSDGMGTPLFTQIVDKTGMGSTSTIADFLDNPAHYIDLDRDTLSELEKVGDGWRLLGKDAAYYTAPGTGAVDLSNSMVIGNYGAVGVTSFAVGSGTRAINKDSVAMGTCNVGLSGETIVEVGNGIVTSPRNAFEIFKDGTVTVPMATDASIDARGNKTLATKEYVQNKVDAEFPASTTDDLNEGSTNLYYTDTRDTTNFNSNVAITSIGNLVDVDLTTVVPVIGNVLKFDGTSFKPEIDLHEVTSVNGAQGDVILSTDEVNQGTNPDRRYFTDAYFNTGFVSKSTTDLVEGTNLYYTDTRAEAIANARISASPLSTLADVGTNAPVIGSVLKHNGSAWQPAPDEAGITEINGNVGVGGVVTMNINDINDVDVSTAVVGDGIKWTGTQWVNSADIDTTYTSVTNSVDGLMTFGDFNKLAGVEAGAQVNVAPTKAVIDALGVNAATVNNLAVETAVPVTALFTDTQYPEITATIGGVLSDVDAVKFAGLTPSVTVEDNLTTTNALAALSANQGNVLDLSKADIAGSVSQSFAADALSAASTLNVGTDLIVSGMTTLQGLGALNTAITGTLTVTGPATVDVLNVAGAATVGTTLGVSGNISGADITATGVISGVDITASGNIGSANITASGNISSVDITASGVLTAQAAGAGTPGLVEQGATVLDSTGADVTANATAINALLASLRTAGIIA